MKLFTQSRVIQACIFIISFSFIILFSPDKSIKALGNEMQSGQNPFLIVEKSEKEADNYFRLVDAQILDDQTLDDLSPALVASAPVKVSLRDCDRIIRQEYDNSICFKRCHIKNDFAAPDYTEKQWRLLIEENGHALFSEIPWENPDKKEKILSYLLDNAVYSGPTSEGIGVWEKTANN